MRMGVCYQSAHGLKHPARLPAEPHKTKMFLLHLSFRMQSILVASTAVHKVASIVNGAMHVLPLLFAGSTAAQWATAP